MSTKLSRRHFLISGAAALGACFLPADILRRARQYQLDHNEVLIEAPESYRRTLYATPQDSGTWQFGLGARTAETPPIPSWRDWLENYQGINVDDRNDLAQWVRENRDYHRLGRKSSDWLDSELCDRTWCNYIDGQYAYQDSPEAQALDYLFRLKLPNRDIQDESGRSVGELTYYFGVHPGNDWHFAEAEGDLVLPALQYRLRELGENTKIEICSNPWN